MTLIRRFWRSPVFVRMIGLLCLLGMFVDMGLLVKDCLYGSFLWRLHVGFFLLYLGQIIFILLRERYTCVLTILQGFSALWTTADFIFTPVLQIVGFLYLLSEPSLEAQKEYMYLFTSAAFTLQMASAAYLWFYFAKGRKEAK